MQVSLTPSYDLSDEYATGFCGTPVLVNLRTGDAP